MMFFEIFKNFVLGMGIYDAFYKGILAFYVCKALFRGWAYMMFFSDFKIFVKSTSIYDVIYARPTL